MLCVEKVRSLETGARLLDRIDPIPRRLKVSPILGWCQKCGGTEQRGELVGLTFPASGVRGLVKLIVVMPVKQIVPKPGVR